MKDQVRKAVTQRELEVLQLLLQGKSNKQIALELLISDFTVRDHVSSLLKKYGAVGRGELIAMIKFGV